MNEKMSFEDALSSIEGLIKKLSRLKKDEAIEGLNQEDLYAELTIVAWRSWAHWKPDGGASFSTFAYTALERGRKSVLRRYRAKSRGYGIPCLPLYDENERENASFTRCLSQKEPDVYDQVYWKEVSPIISHCVNSIKEGPAKQIIKLYLNGLTQEEISAEVRCAQSLVSYYLKKFRTNLRAELVQKGYTQYGSKYDAYIIKEEQ